jgi:hypothetical protein
MLFSCSDHVQSIAVKLERQIGNIFDEVSRVYTNCRFLEHRDRRLRFEICLVFPDPGQYRATLFLDRLPAVHCHPTALRGTRLLPYRPSLAPAFGGEVLAPEAALTETVDGAARICLRVAAAFLQFKIVFTTVERPTYTSIALPLYGAPFVKEARREDPQDPALVLLTISIAFPYAGLHEVVLSLCHGSEWLPALTLYFEAQLPKTDGIPDP